MQTEGEIYSEGVSSIEGGYESGSVEGNVEEEPGGGEDMVADGREDGEIRDGEGVLADARVLDESDAAGMTYNVDYKMNQSMYLSISDHFGAGKVATPQGGMSEGASMENSEDYCRVLIPGRETGSNSSFVSPQPAKWGMSMMQKSDDGYGYGYTADVSGSRTGGSHADTHSPAGEIPHVPYETKLSTQAIGEGGYNYDPGYDPEYDPGEDPGEGYGSMSMSLGTVEENSANNSGNYSYGDVSPGDVLDQRVIRPSSTVTLTPTPTITASTTSVRTPAISTSAKKPRGHRVKTVTPKTSEVSAGFGSNEWNDLFQQAYGELYSLRVKDAKSRTRKVLENMSNLVSNFAYTASTFGKVKLVTVLLNK